MAVRNDFTAGEVLAAADLNDTFASKLPYSFGTATPSTTVDGFLWYDENDTPPAPKFWDGAAFQALTSGKILQVVRATDGTDRTTTSTSLVDASLSVTITPNRSDSAVIVIWTARAEAASTDQMRLALTDNSNNTISGAQNHAIGQSSGGTSRHAVTLIGYATPATTSAVTYKARFASNNLGLTQSLLNSLTTGQLFAIEVAA